MRSDGIGYRDYADANLPQWTLQYNILHKCHQRSRLECITPPPKRYECGCLLDSGGAGFAVHSSTWNDVNVHRIMGDDQSDPITIKWGAVHKVKLLLESD